MLKKIKTQVKIQQSEESFLNKIDIFRRPFTLSAEENTSSKFITNRFQGCLSILVIVFNLMYMSTLIIRMENYDNLTYELSEINVNMTKLYDKSIGE